MSRPLVQFCPFHKHGPAAAANCCALNTRLGRVGPRGWDSLARPLSMSVPRRLFFSSLSLVRAGGPTSRELARYRLEALPHPAARGPRSERK